MTGIKWLGACCILLSGTGMGISLCVRLKERKSALEQILRLLLLLQEEIRFGNCPLKEAFRRVSKRLGGKFGDCLKLTAETMEKGGTDSFSVVFRSCAKQTLDFLPLTKEEKESFFSLGGYLGSFDVAGQIRELEHLQEIFENYLKKADQEMLGKMKLYRNFGIMGAFLLVVLLW